MVHRIFVILDQELMYKEDNHPETWRIGIFDTITRNRDEITIHNQSKGQSVN